MLKLHGFALSNFYNMVQHSLLEKGIEYEEVMARPSQEPDYLARSPMGKVPCLETPEGFLAETNVIMDYLEDIHPEPRLYPIDPFARARAKEIMKMVELYIEAPARRHLASEFFGAERKQHDIDEVRPAVAKGLNALKQLAEFNPYIAGSEFGYADIVTLYSFNLAAVLMQAVYDWDIIAEVPGLGDLFDKIRQSDIAKTVAAGHETALNNFMAQNKS